MKYSATQLHLKTADILDCALTKPVVITKYSKETHVITSAKEYNKLKSKIKELRATIRDNKNQT